MIIFPFKVGALAPFPAAMGQGKADKSVTLTELRDASTDLKTWRMGALARLARKHTERVIRREARRSGTWPLVEDTAPPSIRNRHHGIKR